MLVEKQLALREGAELNREFIDSSISALLSCMDRNLAPESVSIMEKIISSIGIQFQDHRDYYFSNTINSNPEEAVELFNYLATKNNTSNLKKNSYIVGILENIGMFV